MHELSLAQAIVETAEGAIEPGDRVLRIRLQIGELSGVVEEALRFCFDLAAQGTVVESCALEVERIPVRLFCGPCDQIFQPEQNWRLVCPICQTPSADLRSGREFLIHSLEVDDGFGSCA